jgi:hypothetical protein
VTSQQAKPAERLFKRVKIFFARSASVYAGVKCFFAVGKHPIEKK